MLRTVIHKKTAVTAVILLCLLAALATIWPMRLYKEERSFSSGLDPMMTSGTVSVNADAGEYFIAQYDHLQTLEFYVSSVMREGKAHFQLFHVGENGAMELTAEEVVDLPVDVPGFASVSVDADLEPGEEYVYTVRAEDSALFTVAYESWEEASETGTAPVYEVGFYDDSSIAGAALKTRLLYRIDLTKGPSALLALLYTAAAAAAAALTALYYRRKPEKNTLTTILRAMQVVLTPAVLFLFALSFIAIGPFHVFDRRILDILIYEAGVTLGAALCLYGLWHDRSKEPDLVNRELFGKNLWHYGIIICIALIMSFSADYMNALNDRIHDVSTARITAMMFLIVLFMGDAASNFNSITAVVAVVSILCAVIYANLNHVPVVDEETRQLNAVTNARAFAFVLAAAAVTSVVMMLIDRIRTKKHPQTAINRPVLIPVAVFAVMLLIFRNTRTWIPLMLAVWIVFYIRYRYWEGSGRFLQDLCEGILLDFIVKVIYSMLHRYYMAYLYSRFSMHFHTPTVTAYYLCIVAAAAITLFTMRLREARRMAAAENAGRERRRIILAHTWKEAFLLGLAGSYMAMSLSRAGLGVLLVLLVIGSFYMGGSVYAAGSRNDADGKTAVRNNDTKGGSDSTGSRRGRRFVLHLKQGFLTLLWSFLIILVTFPIAFTGQRVISTVYAHPERFEELEPYDDRLMRNVTWNNTRFMNIEIFIRDFGDRIIGGDIGSTIYYGNEWNVPQGYRTSMLPEEGTSPAQENPGLLSAGDKSGLLSSGDKSGLLSAGDRSRLLSAGPGLIPYTAGELTASSEDASADAMGGVGYDGDAGAGEDNTEETTGALGSIDNGDASNGRLYLYRTYIDHLNMTGHDEMGVELWNGEMAFHAHNILIQTAYDCGIPTGIVFAVVLVVLLAAAAWYAARHGGKDGFALEPALLVTGFVLVGMVEWIFHFSNPYTIAVLFAIAPVLFPRDASVQDRT